jgi:ribosomal protein L17
VAAGARAVRLEAAIALIDQRRAALAAQALSLGALLFAEETDHFAARVGGYWRAWRTGAAPAATP